MRKIIPVLLAPLFVACAIATAGAAQPQPAGASTAPPASRHAEARQRFFDAVDTNHDGVVSRAEYQAWVDGRFDRLDSNRDGRVDANEIAQSTAVAERVRKRAERFVRRNDRSGTGTVDKADFEAKAMARFDRLGGGADSVTEDQLGAHRNGFRHRGSPNGQPGDADAGGG